MTRVYRFLLRVYPRWFRERYEAEMLGAFAEERRAPRYTGRTGALIFGIHILADLALSAHRVRREGRAESRVAPGARRSVMETLAQDLCHACRQLVRRPGFTAATVLSLGLGIGGNAVIFAFADGFVFHPFVYPDPDEVVAIGSAFPRVSSDTRFVEAISMPELRDLQQARTIESIAAFELGNRNISGGDRPERVFTALAITDLFAPFGLKPALGRGFTADELRPSGPPAAVVSDRLWRSRFGSDPSIVGRPVRINGVPTTVVGVMPPELLILGADLWVPLGADPASMPRHTRQLTMIGRLARGATLASANAELATIASQTSAQYAAEMEEYSGWQLSAEPWSMALMRDIRPAMRLLLGAVGLVLLIACVNLSNLLLVRSTTRRREMAVRMALGAGRAAIARLLIAEVGLLAIAGAGAGLVLAQAGLPAIVSLIPPDANTLGVSAAINGRVLAWTAGFTVASGLLVALLPLVQAARASLRGGLGSDGRVTSDRRALGLRYGLIVAEIALSVLLLVSAGLLVRSFVNLRNVDPGFDSARVLTMRLTLPAEKYRGAAIDTFFDELIDRIRAIPGVRDASAASQLPPREVFSGTFRIEGRTPNAGTLPTTLITVVSTDHFATLGVPLLGGRTFTRDDRMGSAGVAVVNQAFADRYLPGVMPIGQRITVGPSDQPSAPLEIVGVVADVQNRDMRNPTAPELFTPLLQQAMHNQLVLLVRAAGDAAALLPSVRQQIAAIDPDQPIYAIRTLEEAVAADMLRNRFSMILFAVFAGVALLLAAIGLYGVLSNTVSARTKEIGVRLAVGARRGDVIWMVLRQVLSLTALGLAIGVGGVLAMAALIRRALFEVQPADPLTIVVVSVVLGSVTVVAGWLPAWRAGCVDPVKALRDD